MTARAQEAIATMNALLRSHSRAGLAVIASAGLGVLIALIAVQTSGDSARQNDNWSLPEDQALVLVSSVEGILAEPLFGGDPVVAEPEPEDVATEIDSSGDPWRLLGIVTEGDQRYAVVQNQTLGKLERIVPGDELPGGEHLISVNENSIVYETQEDQTELSLFRDISRTED